MAALAKGVALTFGLVSCPVSVYNALDKAVSGNKQVCTGPAGEEHAVALVTQANTCASCGTVPYTQIKKGRPVDGGYVIITEAEATEASAEASIWKRRSDLTAHAAEEVESTTTPGEKLYYLVPEAGAEVPYAVLAHLVSAHPELAFVSLWTPRSRAGQFRLLVRQGVLTWQERVRQENVRSVPEVTAEAPEAMIGMAEQVLGLPGMIITYDAATYADTYEAKIAEIVAAKDVLVGDTPLDTPSAAPAVATSAMAALQAMLDAAKAEAPPKKARKSATVTPIKKAS